MTQQAIMTQQLILPVTLFCLIALGLNLPFGYLRAGERKRSPKWFLYIHIPIPFVILMRYTMSLSYKYIPLSLAASVIGQLIGGRMRKEDKNKN
jgi:hypothetical protein